MSWISALAELQQHGTPCVLVTIIEERGSTPRNAGSKMVVTVDRIFETIGCGHLEYKAMELAREMLATRSQNTRLERYNLGASLGQCCGGATVLLFEPMGQPQAQPACRARCVGSTRGKTNFPSRFPAESRKWSRTRWSTRSSACRPAATLSS